MSYATQMSNALMLIWEDHDEAMLHEVLDVFAPHMQMLHSLDSVHTLHLFKDGSSLLVEKKARQNTLVMCTADTPEELLDMLLQAYVGREHQLKHALLFMEQQARQLG